MSRILWLTETTEGQTVIDACARPDDQVIRGRRSSFELWDIAGWVEPDLIIVCGWRRLIEPGVLEMPPLGVVGFHSAKLPEYPGRAPVPWTIVRGDAEAWTTLFYLDEGIDSGDIIDAASVPVGPDATVESVYAALALADVNLLSRHLPGLLDGTAPRTPQDPARRGELTTTRGWDLYYERHRLGAGHG
jgi:methionyl-tRNA formyltransferase